MHTSTRFAFAALLAGGALLPLTAHAQIINEDLFRTQYYQQTDANTIIASGADFDARLFTTNPTDLTTATLTYPDGMGGTNTGMLAFQANDPVFKTSYDYNSYTDYPNGLGTAADVDAAYPAGDYRIDYSGGTLGAGSVTANYTGIDLYSNVPMFTAAGFNTLQGLDATQGQTLGINAYAADPGADPHLIFFTLYDATTGDVAYTTYQSVDPNSPPASVFVPGNILLPGTDYVSDLDFSERLDGTDPSNQIFTEQGFDQRTETFFTTAPAAVPEASTTVSFGLLLALGMGGMVIAAKRKKTA
jgi:hypothetical protein